MIIRNNITEVAYNVQTTVDSKHNLPVDYKVTNTNDSKAMGGMLRRAKSIVGHNHFTALYDRRINAIIRIPSCWLQFGKNSSNS